jgi:CARDB/Leishmanolysin/Bacterial pre-peptidase C-terminal domain/Bacterial Ig-like domain (group 2)
MRPRALHFRHPLRASILLVLAGCQTGTTTPENPIATTVTLSASEIALTFLGQTSPVGVTVSDQNGESMSGQTIEWSSSDVAIFTVNSSGVVMAVANGSATVTATTGSLSGTATVTVQQIATGVAIVSGLSQDAINGTALPLPIVAQARDAGGAAVGGATIDFTPDANNGSVDVSSAVADAAGEASTIWTLGIPFGPQRLVARVANGTAEVTAFSRSINPLPDLVVDDVPLVSRSDPSTLETITLTGTIRNDGDASTGAGFRVQVLAGAVEVGTLNVGAIPAFSQTDVAVTVGPLAVGTVALSLVADADDDILELVESNNDFGRNVFVREQSALAVAQVVPISGVTDDELLFKVTLPGPPTTLTVEIVGGTGDADLFAEGGTRPTGKDDYDDCLSFSPGSAERCQIAFAEGEYNILVHAFSDFSGATLSVTTGDVLAPFNIELIFEDNGTASQDDVVRAAATRWEQIIVADIFDQDFTTNPLDVDASCVPSAPTINGVIDDIRIYVRIVDIDGVGGTLAQAGPCYLRLVGDLPMIGAMQFDLADLTVLENNGNMFPVVLHEMGHVLGIGVLWNDKNLLRNPSLDGSGNIVPGQDTHFLGARAIGEFDTNGGLAYIGLKVPVENASGPGSGDSHWRESVLTVELMTPSFNSGQTNPLSSISVASLFDIGYGVDISQAESYQGVTTAPPRVAGMTDATSQSFVDLSGDVRQGPIAFVDEKGRIVRVLR